MAEVINMPRLSDTMEEGTVASWLKKVGDKVEEGDILAEIETDKATMEFESFNEGTLLHIGIEEGETAKVDTLLAIIGEEGEDISSYLNGDAASDDSEEVNSDSEEKETETETESSDSSEEQELPEGVIVVTMPRLSDTMEEGTVATWLKKVGDEVEEGDILAEIETDKATMEFESFQSGNLLYIGLEEGESAKVDSLLAIIGPKGTDVSGIAKNFKSEGAEPKKEAPKAEVKKKRQKLKLKRLKKRKKLQKLQLRRQLQDVFLCLH
ncbi:Dihydrolipoamide acetyltransferase component of pyruvate dehydrogenase complex [Winogradskyella psychrotolerans RS-3]|uniref:Dihydrolipoamide acetyltransferase component of pyruvate dehydrogenase complex n=1 Tax=Winogradskyella psychrotolerans RS-3 TaxID=641526 RepID=S7XAX3_9FLAO|nr:Dihydrolipoamide acetyltransferase component of pyruvate dehydrogenase complex [Winogradskyella psychrotolerans RS-3]